MPLPCPLFLSHPHVAFHAARRNLKFRDVAATVGTSPMALSRLLHKRRAVDEPLLRRIAAALGCAPDEIVDRTPRPDA